jgi:hypothetical protein
MIVNSTHTDIIHTFLLDSRETIQTLTGLAFCIPINKFRGLRKLNFDNN